MNKYAQLWRLGNCVMGIVGLVLGSWIASLGFLIASGESIAAQLAPIAIAAGVVFTFIAGGNSLNDYMDREVDKTAHPERPIPSGRLSAQVARNTAAVMFITSFTLSTLLLVLFNDWISVLILVVISAILIMIAYELRLKKEGLVGNLAIAWLTGALFLLGGAVVGHIDKTVAVGAMAFLATLGREIVKDIQDMAGDYDRRTLPKRIGPRRAGYVASAAFIAAVVLSFEPVVLNIFGSGYLIIVLFADAMFIYCSIVHFQNPERGQSWAKYAMLVALIAFLLGPVPLGGIQ